MAYRHLLSMLALMATGGRAEVNSGNTQPNPVKPFRTTAVASFDTPWAIAFLPDGRMLVTEKPGNLFIVTQRGDKQKLGGVPKVQYSGQNGLLDVALSPHFNADRTIYLSYVEPGSGGSSLALARGRLDGAGIEGLKVIWRQLPKGQGGQPGGVIAFSPDGRYLFLGTGERMRKTPAQDPDQALGKVLRLNLDGSAPSDNPMAKDGGVRAETWTTGHRNPMGLAFAPNGQLWEIEMGPRGGDELNLILSGRNYGWPIVSNGINYNGTPIPQHDTRPEFEKPVVYWTPVIAPGGLAFYNANLFPQWRGSAFTGGLVSESLVRITFDGGQPHEAERWAMGHRIRDVAVGPDGALWVIEDEDPGRLLKLTPQGR